MVYLRKIEEMRWRNPHFYDSDIISDLQTTEHDISVWCYEDGDDKARDKALLAMIMSRSGFKEFFYVEISDKDLLRFNFTMNKKEGETQLKKYKSLHRNIEVKTVVGLTALAWVVKKKISKGEVLYMEVDEERNLFKSLATPSEMSLEDLQAKEYKKIFREVNNL